MIELYIIKIQTRKQNFLPAIGYHDLLKYHLLNLGKLIYVLIHVHLDLKKVKLKKFFVSYVGVLSLENVSNDTCEKQNTQTSLLIRAV